MAHEIITLEVNVETNVYELTVTTGAAEGGLAAEIAAREAADSALDDRVTTLETKGQSRGVYISLEALQIAIPDGNPGDYAYVDAGVGSTVTKYIWDDSDSEWVAGGGSGSSINASNGLTLSGDFVKLGGTLSENTLINLDGHSINFNGGLVGIGVEAPSALLHLQAGTDTVPPLKFTAGTNLDAPEAGAMEFDGVYLSFSPVVGQRRKLLLSHVRYDESLMLWNRNTYYSTDPFGEYSQYSYFIGTQYLDLDGVDTSKNFGISTSAIYSANPSVYIGIFDTQQPTSTGNLFCGMQISLDANSIAIKSGKTGFFGSDPVLKQSVTGAKGGNTALESLLTALSNLGLITNSTT